MRQMIELGNPMANENRAAGKTIPMSEITMTVARSGGPGGQGVNTAESKAILRWHVGNSAVFSAEEKALIRQNAPNMTDGDEIVIHCSEMRNQLENKKICVDRLHAIVAKATVVPEKRVATKMSHSRKERNLDSKTKDKQTKQQRRRVDSD